MVIDLIAVNELLQDGVERVSWSSSGLEPLSPGGAGPAVLLVAEITDAVKTSEGGLVTASLERDGLWSVRSVELDADVFRRLPEESTDLGTLIRLVDEAGYRWRVLPVKPSDS